MNGTNVFSEWMQKIMKERHLSQHAFGELVDREDATISKYVWGATPSWATLEHITKTFGYHLEIVKDGVKTQNFEEPYNIGYEDGYIAAVLEMGKRLKGMKWYGGDYKEKRADRVPGDYAAGTEDLQQAVRHDGTGAGDGGSLGTGAAEGGDPGRHDSCV